MCKVFVMNQNTVTGVKENFHGFDKNKSRLELQKKHRTSDFDIDHYTNRNHHGKVTKSNLLIINALPKLNSIKTIFRKPEIN